ncbi:MAG TPA: muconolactone Delta-isomerase family protein [Candidatus Bathyarchaeia archaeon]|nr:muconolactone Delta-isomerase family protein [Candidatus Bathyarchaeia archaeon]
MKFLVLQWIKPQVPIERLARLTPAQFKYLEKLESDGKIDSYYHLIGRQGHMIVCNANSDNELSRIISEDPLFFDSERQVYPLTTREAHEKRLMEMLGRK